MKISYTKNTNIFLADTFKDPLSDKQSPSDDIFFCGHIGPSMNPTLNKLDMLEITPYKKKRPKIGDVILFKPPHQDCYVVHRIANVDPIGIQTRGDNSNIIDPWGLQKDEICGRVIAAHQGDKRRKIYGGFIGRLAGMSCLVRRKTNVLLVKLLGPAYRSLCTNGILRSLVPVRLTPQVAVFQSDANASHKLLLGKRVIGSYDTSLLQWQIRRPYRIFVDENSLPIPR
jgi:signal peptidase